MRLKFAFEIRVVNAQRRKGLKSKLDIYLMSICMHNIIANSSFSWWGAWLNKNNDKTVIAPTQWFKTKKNEIVPENWIKI